MIRAFYTLYNAYEHINSYDRFACLIIALPQIFGIIFGQIILLSMAVDRLLAVGRPTSYYQSQSLVRVYVGGCIALIFGGFFGFFAMFGIENTPSRQCSTGAAATQNFIKAWTSYGVVMAVLIFGTYTATVIFLIKRTNSTDHNISLSIHRQRKVFVSISLIWLSYAIFWCIPLFTAIVIEMTSSDPVLLGYISLIIAICSGLNSCVGIFIYLAKHPELREYFVKELSKCPKLKKLSCLGAKVGGQHVVTTNKNHTESGNRHGQGSNHPT